MEFLQYFTSLIPIILPFSLLVIFRMSAKKGMSISMVFMIVFGLFVWQVDEVVVIGSVVIGVHKAITILLILFGALALVNTLKNTKAIARINIGFLNISTDKRILAVIIAFLFGALIEGASGFGTPAAITGPLLVGIGFNPFLAAILALVGDSTSVSFGAVGTPLAVGLNGLGIDIGEIANKVTLIDLFSGIFVPLIIVTMYVLLEKKYTSKLKSIKEMIPWTMFVGILYVVFAFINSRIFGFEFVSIITPIIVIGIVSLTTKKGFLVPKQVETLEESSVETSEMNLVKAWSPYIVVVLLLLLTRIVLPIKEFLLGLDFLSINNVFGSSLSSSFAVFYSPGTVLIIASIFASLYQTKSMEAFKTAAINTKGVLIGAMLALVPTLIMVTIFTSSGINGSGLVSMPRYIALGLGNIFGPYWSVSSPFLGMIGSFISGSATVSNLTFGEVQLSIANDVGISAVVILASQVLGAAIGNMICVHNVVAASYVVGLENKEGAIIKKTVIAAIIYAILVSIVTTVIIFT